MNGLIGIIKPTGMYSGKVLGRVKSILWAHLHPTGKKLEGEPKLPKVGHMGTLDPDAEGVLVVGIGKALKGFNEFLNKEKTYKTIFKFGIETNTLDHTGETINTSKLIPSKLQIEKAINQMKGEQLQAPPLVSAVHFNGVRGYNLARKENGIEIEKLLEEKAKPITIHEFKLLSQISNCEFEFEITCSSGTYIRAIARDLAKTLGSYAITTKIDRTQCGVFNYSNSVKFENLNIETIKNNVAL